jgi:hypothetical protein
MRSTGGGAIKRSTGAFAWMRPHRAQPGLLPEACVCPRNLQVLQPQQPISAKSRDPAPCAPRREDEKAIARLEEHTKSMECA